MATSEIEKARRRVRRKRYARKLNAIAKEFDRLEVRTLRSAIQLLRDVRNRISGQLIDTDFSRFRIAEQQRALDDIIVRYDSMARALAHGASHEAFRLGERATIEPLQDAGIGAAFFRPSEAQVNIIAQFSADLISGVSELMRSRINTSIRLNALGGSSATQAMKDITVILGIPSKPKDIVKGIAYEAERILRTEVNRTYNLSTAAQRDKLAEDVPGLEKQWIASADLRTRDSHLEAHGQIVPADKPFLVGTGKEKHELDYPLDPAGPPEETINCRCTSITVIPGIELPPSPLDPKIEKEKKRRRGLAIVKKLKAERIIREKAEKLRLKAEKVKAKRLKAFLVKGEKIRELAQADVPQNLDTLEDALEIARGNYLEEHLDNQVWLGKELAIVGKVSIRVPVEDLDDILRDGEFKNQHGTGTTKGLFDPRGRMDAERSMFGIPWRSDPEDYPVYGYIRTKGYEGHVSGYGDIRVTFKDSVKNRTSFTFGDSLYAGGNGDIVPAPLNDPHAGNATRGAEIQDISQFETVSDNLRAVDTSYAEAQIHGKLTPDDIEKVELIRHRQWPSELVDLLEELGIPFGRFDPRGEDEFF